MKKTNPSLKALKDTNNHRRQHNERVLRTFYIGLTPDELELLRWAANSEGWMRVEDFIESTVMNRIDAIWFDTPDAERLNLKRIDWANVRQGS